MRFGFAIPLAILLFSMLTPAQTAAEFADIWDKEHASHILPSNVRHKDLQKYLDDLKKRDIKISEVGRSVANREIYQIEWGKGPLKVFLWSQMHGDEPTATSALIDIFNILHKNRDKAWVRDLEKTMTIRAVPMLNPDGAELYVRRNLQGVDINRDARSLQTPEANLLKKLRDEWSPDVGFNLHNQNALTTAGPTNKQAAISLLVVFGDAQKTLTEGLARNKRVASLMVQALNNYIPQNIGRYDDDYTATAFGDNFSAWGTPVILIETGSLYGKDEMFLVKMNFIGIMTALRSIADGSEKNADPALYEQLPHNSSGRLVSIVFRGASVVDRTGVMQSPADISLIWERRRAEMPAPATVRAIGDLSSISGLVEYDASNFYVTGRNQPVKPDTQAELLFYNKSRKIDWTAADIEKQFPPDAVFSVGRFVKGDGVVPVKK